MIEFVDLKTGNLFHIKSGDPYTFWFEDGQSLNLNYVKKICFISNEASAYVELNSPVFSILKLNQDIPRFNETNGEIINAKRYIDLDLLKTNQYLMTGYAYTLPGTMDTVYIYMLYIMGSSKDSGEIRDKFKINGEEFEVGADFYAPNEILKSNLENFDISLPEAIQKAIFDVDVHEESNDNITLNRKYKELLMNYWDIVANKGSYNSLLNSLAWFEWGDLVRIEEVWKRHGRRIENYFHTELNHEIDEEFLLQLAHNSKTTYIGLYMALSKITRNKDGQLEYCDAIGGSSPITGYETGSAVHNTFQQDEDTINEMGWEISRVGQTPHQTPQQPAPVPGQITEHISVPAGRNRDVMVYNEPNPNLELVSTKWNLLELCLKMTLLGNFYSTYFMPIHMDLIHSTIEHWVFAYTQKLLNTTGTEHIRTKSYGNTFGLKYDKGCKIKHVENRAYSNTLFKGRGDVFGYNQDYNKLEPVNQPSDFNPLRYFYGGAAGVINFQASIPAIDENDIIYKQRITWYSDTGCIGSMYANIDPDNYDPWFDVRMEPTLWFVRDKYPDYRPGKFICREPALYERSTRQHTYGHTGPDSNPIQHNVDQGEWFDSERCEVEPGIYMYPVDSHTLNNHDWIRLGIYENKLWPIDPNNPSLYPDMWNDERIIHLEGENYTSYPNNDTYEYRWMHNFEFALGFRKAGHYFVTFEFTLTSGATYTRTAEVDVVDDVSNHIKLWSVKPRSENERDALEPFKIEPLLNAFQIRTRLPHEESQLETQTTPVGDIHYEYDLYKDYQEHSIFIQRTANTPLDLNHTVIFDIPLYEYIKVTCTDDEEEQVTTNIYSNNLEEGLAEFDGYLWITSQVNNKIRCIGISRKFQTEPDFNHRIISLEPGTIGSPRWQVLLNPVSRKYEPVIEWRFQPFMFKLEPFENWTPEGGPNYIKATDIIYAEPCLKFSLDTEKSNWKFINISTNEVYESDLFENNQYSPTGNYGYRQSRVPIAGGMQSTFVLPYTEAHLNPGYYSIELHYTKGGVHQVCKYDSAFIIGK